jgi:hypothetical protein
VRTESDDDGDEDENDEKIQLNVKPTQRTTEAYAEVNSLSLSFH